MRNVFEFNNKDTRPTSIDASFDFEHEFATCIFRINQISRWRFSQKYLTAERKNVYVTQGSASVDKRLRFNVDTTSYRR